jgi:hypothetical protein
LRGAEPALVPCLCAADVGVPSLGRGSLGLMSRSDGLMSRPGPKTRNPGHKPQK